MLKGIIASFLIFFAFALKGQSRLYGIIRDKSDSVIQNVNVIVKSFTNDSIISFCSSNNKGEYDIKINKIGTYSLNVTSLNYKIYFSSFSVISDNQKIKQNITLIDTAFDLNEIIIKSEIPIIVKNDTIIYDVKTFMIGNEKVVEDMLKKLPGITVDADGTIKFGGEEVEKIMVEGNDFFEKGYKLLSRNMPSGPINKVELYKHFSNNKHLKGVETTEKIALNLKIEEGSKSKFFGNLNIGYHFLQSDKYENNFNLMNFSKG